ncbi:MAG: hypothetical protein R3C68_04665 [Myxococcota bacterium]
MTWGTSWEAPSSKIKARMFSITCVRHGRLSSLAVHVERAIMADLRLHVPLIDVIAAKAAIQVTFGRCRFLI